MYHCTENSLVTVRMLTNVTYLVTLIPMCHEGLVKTWDDR